MPARSFGDERDESATIPETVSRTPRELRTHPVDRVTVRALRFALAARADHDHMVNDLIATAEGNRAALARALQRLYTRSEGRPLGVTAARATALVRAALDRETASRGLLSSE